MKRFSFPLARVMDWRDAQARVEENKLERLYVELRGIEARIAILLEEREKSQNAVLNARGALGSELAALDAFRRFSVLEHARLDALLSDCSRRVAAQTEVVALKRRDVRLLERLKQRRLAAWRVAYGREIDAQAEESHLAKWNR